MRPPINSLMPFIIIEGNRTNKTNNALSLKTSTAANKLTIAATLLVQYYKAFFNYMANDIRIYWNRTCI